MPLGNEAIGELAIAEIAQDESEQTPPQGVGMRGHFRIAWASSGPKILGMIVIMIALVF